MIGGFLFRLIPLLINLGDDSVFLRSDSSDYLVLSGSLVSRGTYGDGHVFRTPGYPTFLAFLSIVSGSKYWFVFVQIILDMLNCILTYKLCLKALGDEKIAKVAFAFQCFSIVSISYSLLILSETLFTFVFLVFLNLYSDIFIKGGKAKQVLLMSTVYAMLIYVRAVASLYLLVPLFFLLLKKRFKETAILLTTVVVLCSFWGLRNKSVANYSGFSSVSSINLYRYNACLIMAHKENKTFKEKQLEIDKEFSGLSSQNAIYLYAKKRGIEEILKSPFLYGYLHLKASLNSFAPASGDYLRFYGAEIGGNGTLAVINSKGYLAGVKHYFGGSYFCLLLILPLFVMLLMAYLLTLLGFLRALQNKQNLVYYGFLAVTLFYFLFVGGSASHPRFRVPVAPVFSSMAALGYFYFMDLFRGFSFGKKT